VNNGTKSVHVCFGTNCTFPPGFASDDCERLYQNTYKPLLSSLYNIPELPFTLSLSGPLIEWMEHHHPEFFMILEEMVARKQIEILGGGYYSPLFRSFRRSTASARSRCSQPPCENSSANGPGAPG